VTTAIQLSTSYGQIDRWTLDAIIVLEGKRASMSLGLGSAPSASPSALSTGRKLGAGLTQAGTISGASSRGSHQLAAARTCARLWTLRYYLRIRPKKKKEHLVIGTCVHTMLAYHYASMLDDPPFWFAEVPMERQLAEEAAGHPDWLRMARGVFDAYKSFITPDPWQPVFVEEEFSARLGDMQWPSWHPCPDDVADEVVTGKFDLVILQNGELYVVDHKTSADRTRNGRLRVWNNNNEWQTTPQLLHNMHIARVDEKLTSLGKFIRAPVINRLKRTSPCDFDRHVIHIPDLAYEETPLEIEDAVRTERKLKILIEAGGRPPPNRSACVGRYGNCDYYELCKASSRDERDDILDACYESIDG